MIAIGRLCKQCNKVSRGNKVVADLILPVAGRDLRYAADAGLWLERFYAGLRVTLRSSSVELVSERHDSAMLERQWRCALANERLLDEQGPMRAQLLAELLR